MKEALLTFLQNPAKTLLLWAIRGYQVVVSPGLPSRCKYYPSCSQYAVDAVREYGATRGLVLAGWRLLRCNPLSYGGYDPVSHQRLFAPRRTTPHVGVGAREGGTGPATACTGVETVAAAVRQALSDTHEAAQAAAAVRAVGSAGAADSGGVAIAAKPPWRESSTDGRDGAPLLGRPATGVG